MISNCSVTKVEQTFHQSRSQTQYPHSQSLSFHGNHGVWVTQTAWSRTRGGASPKLHLEFSTITNCCDSSMVSKWSTLTVFTNQFFICSDYHCVNGNFCTKIKAQNPLNLALPGTAMFYPSMLLALPITPTWLLHQNVILQLCGTL